MKKKEQLTESEIAYLRELERRRTTKYEFTVRVSNPPEHFGLPDVPNKEEKKKKRKKRMPDPNVKKPEPQPLLAEQIREKWIHEPGDLERMEALIAHIDWTDEEMAELNAARKKRGVKQKKKPPRTRAEIVARSKELAKIPRTYVRELPRVKSSLSIGRPRFGPEDFPDDLDYTIRRCVDSIIHDSGLIAVVRGIRPWHYLPIAEKLYEAGVRVVDFPFVHDVVNANVTYNRTHVNCMRRLVQRKDQIMCIGVGDITNFFHLMNAKGEDVHFYSTSALNTSYITHVAKDLKRCAIAGAYTPTEVHAAYTSGADFVKLYPMNSAGPAYVGAIHRIMPYVPLIAAGGVTADNIKEYFKAGADVVSVGKAIITPELIYQRKYDQIIDNAKRIVDAVGEAKATVWKERIEYEKEMDPRIDMRFHND